MVASRTFSVTFRMLKSMSSMTHFPFCAVSGGAAVCREVSFQGLCSHWCYWELMPSYSPACMVPMARMCIHCTESQRGSKDMQEEGGKRFGFLVVSYSFW